MAAPACPNVSNNGSVPFSLWFGMSAGGTRANLVPRMVPTYSATQVRGASESLAPRHCRSDRREAGLSSADREVLRRGLGAEFRRHVHQVGEGGSLHLSHHVASMCLHRYLADAELATHLFVQQAGDHQRHDLPFATTE